MKRDGANRVNSVVKQKEVSVYFIENSDLQTIWAGSPQVEDDFGKGMEECIRNQLLSYKQGT